MQETILNIVAKANSYLADYILIILLIGVGLFFTIKTKFVQVRCFGEGMKKVFGNIKLFGNKNESGLSSFQALATAIAAQVGTGNIVGASGAILVGGPGAIFWMWVIAFLGMATIYAEAVLAQETRVKDSDGEIHGGPVYYMKKAFPNGFGTFLAVFFAIAITLALGFMGSMVQSNSIAEACNTAFGVPTYVIGGKIVETDKVDVYDGYEFNGYTGSKSDTPTDGKLYKFTYFTDTMKDYKGTSKIDIGKVKTKKGMVSLKKNKKKKILDGIKLLNSTINTDTIGKTMEDIVNKINENAEEEKEEIVA